MNDPLVSFDVQFIGVTKQFDGVVAVDNLTFEVLPGEFLSIIGPSGCGKTTTLRLIAGLEQPDSGQIHIKGRRMDGVPPYERNIGLVFQSFALFPHLNVIDNVKFGLRMRGVPRGEQHERALQALRMVGMEDLAMRRIDQLSGGQKQRVGLARALVIQPSVILLDEPLGSLDAKLRIEMQSELKILQRQMGITFIHVSHNQSEALAMADRIAVMNSGRFEQVGTPYEIYNRPRTRFVAEFVGRNNIFEGDVVDCINGHIKVRTPDGLFTVATREREVSVGMRVTFVVRADLMRLTEDSMDCSGKDVNMISGVVQGLEYAGSVVLIVLRMESGSELKVELHESLTQGRAAPRHGDVMTFVWSANDAYVLP